MTKKTKENKLQTIWLFETPSSLIKQMVCVNSINSEAIEYELWPRIHYNKYNDNNDLKPLHRPLTYILNYSEFIKGNVKHFRPLAFRVYTVAKFDTDG